MKARRLDREGDRVTVPADIHDIRVLTSTGPIPLPLTPAPDVEQRRA